jgi:transcriptional regulator with XRE-family HTH domain
MSGIESVTTSAAILGAVFVRLRKEKGFTQEDLGKEAGVGASTWSRIEQGESQLSTDQLRAAAKKLGVSAAYILGKAEEIEDEFKAKGVHVGDIPPKTWAGVSSGLFDKALPYLGIAGAILPGLLIPLAGAALNGLVAKYWEDQEVDKDESS